MGLNESDVENACDGFLVIILAFPVIIEQYFEAYFLLA